MSWVNVFHQQQLSSHSDGGGRVITKCHSKPTKSVRAPAFAFRLSYLLSRRELDEKIGATYFCALSTEQKPGGI